jgi:hypothetical protein
MRSDNGPEFVAYAVPGWLREEKIETAYIEPGKLGRTVCTRASTDGCETSA